VLADDRLCSAIKATGEAYNEVGLLFEEQPKADWEPLGDVLHIYKGLIASFPDILAVHRVSRLVSRWQFTLRNN
jgi:sorting nexin-9/18/33